MIRVEITEVQFFYGCMLLFFNLVCEKCGRETYESLTVYSLTNLHVGCSRCSSSPSFSAPLYPLLLETVETKWGYPPEDVKKIDEKLQTYLLVEK